MMKKFFLATFFLSIMAMAQLLGQAAGNQDIILKVNGDEMLGTVTEITDTQIKFKHEGESLVYTIDRRDVLKITFASGRIEFFNKPQTSTDAQAGTSSAVSASGYGTPGEHHNKVAILPFHYLLDKQDAGEEMTYKVQREAYTILSNHIGYLTLQDPNTTNALLIKAGVSNNNLRGFTMGEICSILGVEYVVQGTITQNSTTATTSTSTSTTYKNTSATATSSNSKNAVGTAWSNNAKSTSSTSSSTQQNYQTSVNMNIYTDKGESIYSQDHTGFWPTTDAYKVTLQYMLKRTPIYKK